MRKWWPALVGALVLVVVVAVVLVTRQGGDDGAARPTASASASPAATPTAESMTTAELEALVFAGDVGTSEAVVSTDGLVGQPGIQTTARVDVTGVVANEFSTMAYFTLVNTSGSDAVIPMQAFNAWRPLLRDIRDVTLVDPEASQRYWAYRGQSLDESQQMCACSTAPLIFGPDRGHLLSATFPALDPATTSVTLAVPGFPDVEVPVTRQ